MEPAVETRGLTRRFGARTAVDAVSMTAPRQSVYGFLGRNGAGKTTTIKLLLGLLKPTAGEALICGVDVARDRLKAARQVGALLESQGFYGNLTGRENLDLTRTMLGLPASEVDRTLEAVEMTAHGKRGVSDYSLGMRQRLGIARAMLGAPPVLILDEPSNGLDPDGIADMRRFLRALPERAGAAVLVSSHLLGEIEQTATHVGILKEGRLVLEGELAALKARLSPEIAVDTDDTARAADLAAARGFEVADRSGQLLLRLKPRDDARAASAVLSRALVEAGLEVFAIGARTPSLEALYAQVATSEIA